MISIIVPVLNEEAGIAVLLRGLQRFRHSDAEIIVVDGGSSDRTVAAAGPLADRIVSTTAGRSRQMNAGAALARGDSLLFLHADTTLPDSACDDIKQALSNKACVWGRFDVRIDSQNAILHAVSLLMNFRSRLTGIATGDQAIFVRRDAFERIAGFPEIALMEDIAISRSLKQLSPPACIPAKAITSARRWERDGALRTILLIWQLRLRFFFGADPDRLAERYGYTPYRRGS